MMNFKLNEGFIYFPDLFILSPYYYLLSPGYYFIEIQHEISQYSPGGVLGWIE